MILILPRVRAVPATVLSRCQIVPFAARPGARLADDVADVLELVAQTRTKGVDALFRRTQSADRERAEALIDACVYLLRDLLLVRAGAPAELLVGAARAADVARMAAAWRTDDILGALTACREARLALVNNVTPRLTIEVVVSRLLGGAAEGAREWTSS
jgi:DNA polymerase III gamma/tau subunit